MSDQHPEPGAIPPLDADRDPGDAWVITPTGERFWGRFGAAGLLAVDANRGVLLQHRISWSHFGNTWALPGGARHQGESAVDGALRESAEEAGVTADAVVARALSVLDLDVWSYSTLIADVVQPFDPVISDPESRQLAWVPVDEVAQYPLHPGFAASWPGLRALLSVRPAVVVDAANVVGSVPDGWWRDRAGAADRLLDEVAAWAAGGVAAATLGLDADVWYPEVHVVLEGQARVAADRAGLTIVRADAEGDDTIVSVAEALVREGRVVTVVTSDRGLGDRVVAAGAGVRAVSWLRDQLA